MRLKDLLSFRRVNSWLQFRSPVIRTWLAAFLICAAAMGQLVSGRVTGIVVDPDRAAAIGARVTLLNQRTGQSTERQTNESGLFVFQNVPPGIYTVRVRLEGFTTYEQQNIILNANASVALGEISLALGAVTETITVESSGNMVELDTSGQSQLVTSNQMQGLMATSRDVLSLMKILPGASQQSFGAEIGLGGVVSGQESVNFSGTRRKWNSIKVDGQPGQNVDQINRLSVPIAWDAVEEVIVQPVSYLAEHGRSTGAHINIISKSGTNEFHGSGYWFWRHEQFNANNFFNNRDGLPKPVGRFHSYGGTLGGPIVKEKLFFFVSREWWRVAQASNIRQATLPTALERAGDFSQTVEQNGRLVPINDPTSRERFQNNVVPTSRINVFGQRMLNVMPLGNTPESFLARGYNNILQQRTELPKNQTQFKIDYLPSASDRVSYRPRWFDHDSRGQFGVPANFLNTNFPLQPHHYNFGNQGHLISWTRTVSPTVVNEASGSFFRSFESGELTDEFDLSGYLRPTHGLDDLPLLFPGANDLNIIPEMQFGGVPNSPLLQYDNRLPIDAEDTRWNFQDTLSWIPGNHNLKFGFFYEIQNGSEGPEAPDNSGRFQFNRDGNNPLDTNHPFSNAILGVFREFQQSNQKSGGRFQMQLWEWFAQDTWKATRRLSFDFGVRFTKFTPWKLRDREGSAFDFGLFDPNNTPLLYRPARAPATNRRVARNPLTGELLPAPLIGAVVPNSGDRLNGMIAGGFPEFGDAFQENPPLQVAPRFGFAFDAFGRGNTVVRGGFGVFKQAIFASGLVDNTKTGPPIVESPTIFFNTIDDFVNTSQVLFPPGEVYAFSRSFENVPTVYKWSFGIQQSLGWGTLLDVAYVGNNARHLLQSRQINSIAPGTRFEDFARDETTGRPLPDNFLRPYQGYQSINLRSEYVGWSNYHSLQTSLNRRYASGLQFGVAYTWAKSMGITEDDIGGLPMFTNYRSYLYGKLPFDQTHVLVLNYLYSLPNLDFFSRNSVTRGIFHHWEISGITTFSSGFPEDITFSYSDGVDRWGGGDSPRVVMLAKPTLPRSERTADQWFNTSAFGAPGFGDFGNAPVDVFREPGINNFIFSINKNFPVTERVRLQLKTEFYNLFNHTQFNNVDNGARFDAQGNQIDGRFGQVIGAANARELQFSLRLSF